MVAKNDRAILRDLAKRVSEIANLDVMGLRREKWRLHNDLKTKEPLILVNPEGAFAELIPYSALRCEGDEARNIEWNLTSRIYYHENIDDDSVISDDFFVEKRLNGIGAWNAIDVGLDWGLKGKLERTPDSPQGAYRIEPVINNIDDIQKLKIPSLSYDGKATLADMEEKQELFGDILNVRIKGITHIMFHVMYFYIHYRGLEQMFFDLHDEPEFARELIGFFVAGYESILEQCVELNAFDLNNGSTPVATGGFGNTGELPKKDFSPDKVRLCDLWACAESQEMHPASPEMTEEFVICHERRLLSKFGLASYGCCEALDNKLQYVLKLPNIRRLSVSPFADVKKCAEVLQDKYVFSWKPNPVFLCAPNFDPPAIKQYLKDTREQIKDCIVEVVLADTHTCRNEGWRFKEWVQICRSIFN